MRPLPWWAGFYPEWFVFSGGPSDDCRAGAGIGIYPAYYSLVRWS